MHDNFSIKRGGDDGHSYTNDQAVLDIPHHARTTSAVRILRRHVMIPSSTGAAEALSEVIPALRASSTAGGPRPTMDVSRRRPHLRTEKNLTKRSDPRRDEGRVRKARSKHPRLHRRQLVSTTTSAIRAPRSSTRPSPGRWATTSRKVFSWYDNEWGFSNRMIELAQLVPARRGVSAIRMAPRASADSQISRGRLPTSGLRSVDFSVPLDPGRRRHRTTPASPTIPTIKHLIDPRRRSSLANSPRSSDRARPDPSLARPRASDSRRPRRRDVISPTASATPIAQGRHDLAAATSACSRTSLPPGREGR